MAWEEAKFKSGKGGRKPSPSEEAELVLKFGIVEILKHMQSKSAPSFLRIFSLLQNLKCLMIMSFVLRTSQASPEAGLKLHVHIPNEQGLEVRTGEDRHSYYYWKIKYSKHSAKIISPEKIGIS